VDLYGFVVEAQPLLLVGKELLDILALVALQLDHLAHLGIGDDGAIAGKLLLDHLKDLLLVEFLGQALDRGQRLAAIALCGRRVSGYATARQARSRVREGTYAGYGCECNSDWLS
jgi:hypothetical protein